MWHQNIKNTRYLFYSSAYHNLPSSPCRQRPVNTRTCRDQFWYRTGLLLLCKWKVDCSIYQLLSCGHIQFAALRTFQKKIIRNNTNKSWTQFRNKLAPDSIIRYYITSLKIPRCKFLAAGSVNPVVNTACLRWSDPPNRKMCRLCRTASHPFLYSAFPLKLTWTCFISTPKLNRISFFDTKLLWKSIIAYFNHWHSRLYVVVPISFVLNTFLLGIWHLLLTNVEYICL